MYLIGLDLKYSRCMYVSRPLFFFLKKPNNILTNHNPNLVQDVLN
jgi:hypothetical protein